MLALAAISPTENFERPTQRPSLPASYLEPRWYAAYTNANHEKRVANQFASLAIEHFLPLYESLRKWKDRKVRLQLPLFPGYVFVRMALQEHLRVLKVAGVSKLVGFGGTPTPLPQEEIDALLASVKKHSGVFVPDYHQRVTNETFYPEWGRSYGYILNRVRELGGFHAGTPLEISRTYLERERALRAASTDERRCHHE